MTLILLLLICVNAQSVLDLKLVDTPLGRIYKTSIGIGTPPQFLDFVVDTGNADSWVLESHHDSTNNRITTQFTPALSSTFKTDSHVNLTLSNGSITTYLNGLRVENDQKEYALGKYFTDTLTLGESNASKTLENVTLGLINETNCSNNVLGLAFPGFESCAWKIRMKKPEPTYENLPQVLNSQFQTSCFSLYLNGAKETPGNLVFNGIDTKKFKGEIKKLPIAKTIKTSDPQDFSVYITNTVLKSNNTEMYAGKYTYRCNIETSQPVSYLYDKDLKEMMRKIEHSFDKRQKRYFITSGVYDSLQNVTLILNFHGIHITTDFQLLFTESEGELAGKYFLSLLPQQANKPLILGTNILKYMYTVFDFKNFQIGIAQSIKGANESEIKEIPGLVSAQQTL